MLNISKVLGFLDPFRVGRFPLRTYLSCLFGDGSALPIAGWIYNPRGQGTGAAQFPV